MKDKIESKVDDLELLLNGDESSALSLRINGFDEDKDFDRFIKSVEKLVRHSREYREWVKYLIEVLECTNCALTEESNEQCSTEIHHHPINLYSIVKSVTIQNINKENEFCSFDIAQEVMELHFQNRVGFIPLIKSIHEKYHNGYLDIPIDLCQGDWKYLLNTYTFEDEELQSILRLASIKKEDLKLKWTKNQYPGVVNS